jgi:hypothetical protein
MSPAFAGLVVAYIVTSPAYPFRAPLPRGPVPHDRLEWIPGQDRRPRDHENAPLAAAQADLILDYEQLLDLLADPFFSAEGKADVERELADEDVGVIPFLIGHLTDARPAVSTKGRTVGGECERLLYAVILSPYGRSMRARLDAIDSNKALLGIKSWGRWWSARRDLSLDEIQAQTEELLSPRSRPASSANRP